MDSKVRTIDQFQNVKKKPARKKSHRSRVIFVTSFLIIPIINFIIFYVYVNLDSFVMAFQKYTLVDGVAKEVFTIENFQTVWTQLTTSSVENALIRESFLNTLLFFSVNMFIVMPLTIFLTYFLYKKISGYRFYRAVLYLPCIIASSALVALYKIALGNGGLYEAVLKVLGVEYRYPFATTATYQEAMGFIMFYNVIFGIGGNVIVISGAMNSIDKEILEAARIDGCNWFNEFIKIVIPSIWPTLSTILILSVAGLLAASGPILAFDQGAHQTHTLAFYIFALVSGMSGVSHGEYLASAIGLCMTVVSFPMAMVVKRIVYGKEK